MNIFICLFFPTMISITIMEKKRKLNLKQTIEKYCIYNIFVNIFTLFFVNLTHNNEILYMNTYLFTLSFTMKYMAVASIFAYIMPDFEKYFIGLQSKTRRYLKKNINIKFYKREKDKQ